MYDRLASIDDRGTVTPLSRSCRWARRLISELAIQDWLVWGYLLVLLGALLVSAPPSPARTTQVIRVGGLVGTLTMVLVLVRGSLLTRPRLASLIYRLTIYGVVQVSYFMLRGILPLVSNQAFDTQLYQLDLHLFGVEPALWMDRFINRYTTEWFAFFYYGYFFVLGLHVLLPLLFGRRRRLFAEFALGLFTVYCVSHILYMIVPGFGPYRFLAGEFRHPLSGGFWLTRVLDAVKAAGAQKDIFPSLHTGGPAFIFLFSLRHRHRMPYKITWPIVGFFFVNIMIATMFLRWHYLIDVVAGALIATGAVWMASRVSRWEWASREARGLGPVWMPIRSEREGNQDAPAISGGR